MKCLRAAATVLATIGAAALCGGAAAQDLSTRLATARAQFAQSGVADYRYGFNRFCECYREAPPETLVEVRDGAIHAVHQVMAKTGDTVAAPADRLQYYRSIEDLYTMIERALSSDIAVSADFDAQTGLPTRVWVDYRPDIVGDEIELRLTRFDRL